MLNLVKCDLIKDIFAIRNIPYTLRTIRELEEKNTNKGYIYDSTIFRLRRKWNKIIVPTNLSSQRNLSKFKIESKKLINIYK